MGKKNLSLYYGRRGLKRRMAVADVVILNIARILDRTGDLKDTNKSIGFIMAFLLHLADDAKQWLLPSCPIVKKNSKLSLLYFQRDFCDFICGANPPVRAFSRAVCHKRN